jgi:hypothetical protein
MTALLALALSAAAHGAVPVFIAPFDALDHGADELAHRMPAILSAELAPDPDMRVIDLASVPDIGDTSAVRYMDTCPPGQIEGCSYVVGEAAGAAYALLGTVRTLPPSREPLDEGAEPPSIEREVSLRILDVKFYNEVLSVVLVHTDETEDSFADAVLMMMQDAAAGWVGAEVDIRTTGMVSESGPDRDEAARELEDLDRELGEVAGQGSALSTSEPHRVQRDPMSLAQLLEGHPPETWEELGLEPEQYLAWWNSGWDYPSWSRRLWGRRGQILLRGHGGMGLGPTHGLYHGRVSYRGGDLIVEHAYATHELNTGLGSHLGMSLGYGLSPKLEIELGASREGGRYAVDARMVYPDSGAETVRENSDEAQGTPQLWLGARWVPTPHRTLRPVAGLGVACWLGHGLAREDLPMEHITAFTAPVVTSLRMLGGVELRINQQLDLLAQVPVHLLLAGTNPAVYDDQQLSGEGYGMEELREPGRPFPLAASLQLGVQLRLGGMAPKARPVEEDEGLDELQ